MFALLMLAAGCMLTPDMHEALSEKHRESRAMVGLSDRGFVVEIWTGKDGAWSAVVTKPDGTSCMVDAGQAAQIIPQGEPA